jgi:REP element-mobilizing transposase RayT
MATSLSSLRVSLPGFPNSVKTFFGGSGLRSNPKEARPFSSKLPMHFIFAMRNHQVVNQRAISANRIAIFRLYQRHGKSCGLKLLRFQIFKGHLHVVLRCQRKKSLQRFLRATSGVLARRMLGAERGSPSYRKNGFWEGRPFSQILNFACVSSKKWNQVLSSLVQQLVIPSRTRSNLNFTDLGILTAWVDRISRSGPGVWRRLASG